MVGSYGGLKYTLGSVDDSTAIIECTCKLSRRAPLSIVLQRAVTEGTLKSPPEVDMISDEMEVGMLVRVVGEIIEGVYTGAPRRLSASKIGE